MNQTDLIQNILSTERQAKRLTAEARTSQAHLDDSIQAEIAAMEERYERNAAAYLQRFQERQEKQREAQLRALEDRKTEKLRQVEEIYEAHRDEWVEAIFRRIVGQAEQ